MKYPVNTLTYDKKAQEAVKILLALGGDDPDREGLQETPERVVRAWRERLSGYEIDPETLFKTFEDDGKTDEMIICHNIPVISMCEHHCADIIGVAHVGYIPQGRIVGLSKLARLVDCFARRLQVQERMTAQIADALMEGVGALGVGVLIRAAHHCMATRGVRIHGSTTSTSAMRGAMMEEAKARSEFFAMCAAASQGIGI